VKHNGATYDYFENFNSNNFSTRSTAKGWPNAPIAFRKGDKFESSMKLWFNHLARARAYFVAPEDGSYTFYLVCKTWCVLNVLEDDFEGDNIIITKTVGADIQTDAYTTK